MSVTATIASGATGLSAGVDLGGLGLLRIIMPATWVAASLTFATSPDGTTYSNLYDDAGTEVTATVAASRSVVVDPTKFISINWLKVRSGTSGTPVDQTASRDLILVTRTLA